MTFQTKLFATVFSACLLGGVLLSCNSGNNTNGTETNVADSSKASNVQTATDSSTASPVAEAVISATYADTAVSGTASFTTQSDGKVKLDLQLTIPSRANKEVAVHLHEHGDCSDAGMGSHGHWNPTNEAHGKWGSAHFHRGDIGNVKLDKDGKGSLEMTTDLWQIGGNDSTKNILGRAVIVHGGVDDYVTQPTGNAGNRIGCGVIK